MVAGFGTRSSTASTRACSSPSSPWHSTAGAKLYNQKDKDKARRLLKEAGYAGQPVRWITTREYEWMYKNALVAKQQLEEVGFKVDLQVVDWATLVQRAQQARALGRVLHRLHLLRRPGQPRALPLQLRGWWCNEEKERLLGELASARPTLKKRKAMHRPHPERSSTRTWAA